MILSVSAESIYFGLNRSVPMLCHREYQDFADAPPSG